MLLLIKAFKLLNSGLGILIFHIPLIQRNAVYEYAYKQVWSIFLEAVPFQTLALQPNLFMHFGTEAGPCLRLYLKKLFCRIKHFKVLSVPMFYINRVVCPQVFSQRAF